MRKVVITGMGIVSPVGTGVEYAWQNVLNGKSGVKKIDSRPVGGKDEKTLLLLQNEIYGSYISATQI